MTLQSIRRCLLLLAVVLPLGAVATATPVPANGKLKIFILSGQSNMVGFGQVAGSPGTMESCVQSNPRDYHWFRNWETLYLIGKGMGDAMTGLDGVIPPAP